MHGTFESCYNRYLTNFFLLNRHRKYGVDIDFIGNFLASQFCKLISTRHKKGVNKNQSLCVTSLKIIVNLSD